MHQIAPLPEPAIRDIALCRGALATGNVRKTPPDDDPPAQLPASIKAHGLMTNLGARPGDRVVHRHPSWPRPRTALE